MGWLAGSLALMVMSWFSCEAPRIERTLQALRGRHVLTVTDFTGAGSDAAIIALKTENNRIRMRINVEEARANNLVISSKLLRLAGP